jgi:serine/threonine-protein kinase
VAVKVITAETARNDTLVGRFEREARATMPIDTPHIVRVLDAGTDGPTGLPFLVMEFLEGEDVSHLVKRLGPLAPDLALRLVAQACLGLQKAHEARIIHRDIKPANFYLAREGQGGARTVKLLDFGIAKITRDPEDSKAETAGLTRTGSMLGSPLYMSPEQARGLKEIDRRADIWSLGVVLYQALTGRTPHHDSDALGELIIAICTEVPAPIQELAPWVPPAVALVAHQAMRFDPAERYQSAADMLEAIRPLLPAGWSIDEAMFRPLDDVERSKVEERHLTMPDTPVPRGGRTAPGDAVPPGTSIDGFGKTVGERSPGSAATPTPALPSRTLIYAGAALALLSGGLLAFELFGSAAAGRHRNDPAAAEPPRPRTVRLVVLPEGATVEVDGAPAAVTDGVVEITGTLGSVHEVRLHAGGEQATHGVVVAESGPVPAKVQLDARPAASAVPAAAPKPAPLGSVRSPGPRPSAPPDLRGQR